MGKEALRSRFLGCVVGSAIGDALGAPLELWDKERVAQHPQGTDWIEDLLPFVGRKKSPLGIWRDDPPRGTATDDTRLNQVFLEACVKYGSLLNSKLLAAEYVDRYVNRDRYFPGYHDLATRQFALFFAIACGVLEVDCPILPGVPAYALRSTAHGRDRPSLIGVYTMHLAGLLHPGDPEAAYRHAYELSYADIGYARDATALLAAIQAAALDENLSPRSAIRGALGLDPFRFGEGQSGSLAPWTPRTMVERIGHFLDLADRAQTDRDLVLMLSREVTGLARFDPIDAVGFPVACCYRADGDPRRAMLMAVNDRYLDDRGEFVGYRDIDCTGSIAGSLAGAMAGIEAFPPEWVSSVVQANREVYGFDVEASANQLYDAIVTRS